MKIRGNLNFHVSLLCRKAGTKDYPFKTCLKNIQSLAIEIQSLAIELFKVFKGCSNPIVFDNFCPKIYGLQLEVPNWFICKLRKYHSFWIKLFTIIYFESKEHGST